LKRVALLILTACTLANAQQSLPSAPASTSAAPAPVTTPLVQPAPVQPAPAPQISVAIGSFSCKVALCTLALGDGIADALATAMLNTGRFALYERENVSQLTEENFFNTGSPTQKFQGADVVIFGSITGFEPDAQNGAACFFGVCLGGRTSTIGADLRVVDAHTRRVIAGAHVDGSSNSSGVSLNVIPGLSLGNTQSSGTQKAISDLLAKAVDTLLQRIPASYAH